MKDIVIDSSQINNTNLNNDLITSQYYSNGTNVGSLNSSNSNNSNNNTLNSCNGLNSRNNSYYVNNDRHAVMSASLERRASRLQKDTRKRMHKLNMGEATDDVHECVRCLRAIMNHQYGFHMVIVHSEAINSIALSLKHKEFR